MSKDNQNLSNNYYKQIHEKDIEEIEYENEYLFDKLIRQDGETNLNLKGIKKKKFLRDLFHTIVDLPWRYLIPLIICGFMCSYLFFGLLYYLGRSALDHNLQSFHQCFYFSVQTQATIGYGYMSPGNHLYPNFIVVIQICVGVLEDSTWIGLLYQKFTRPTTRRRTILFSRTAVIHKYRGVPCLMIRVANIRRQQLLASKTNIFFLRKEKSQEGIEDYQITKLSKIEIGSPGSFLALPSLIVHPIDENSLFFNRSKNDLKESQIEIIVSLDAVDTSTSNAFQSRYSYTFQDLEWNHHFRDIVTRKNSGVFVVNFEHFHTTDQDENEDDILF
ncbi:inward rectifier potassium channel [Anaeramoeba ignava]|uniref:Inward rectifier potassium channel n=1 Tax=Anaeramoeba ignava TaxID=1746090 RepID=A0A9Q0R9L3_ANAIG|nr:inward rectifier potassium channel [Anaeramoeba ignava]